MNRIQCRLAALLFLGIGCHSAAVAQSVAPSASDEIYIYYYEELREAAESIGRNEAVPPTNPFSAGIPRAVAQLRQGDAIFEACAPRSGTGGQKSAAAAFAVPLVVFGFKLFASVVEADLADKERQRLAAFSRSYSQVRSDVSFPEIEGAMRCLVVDRLTRTGESFTSGATYVLGLRPVGSTAFTIEPLAARIDASPVLARQRSPTLNANLSLAIQSVVPDQQMRNELITLPVYSVSYENLRQGRTAKSYNSARRSPVIPFPPPTSPTSVTVAVTEAHTRLGREKQRIALEQANRAALVGAASEALKGALTD